MKSVVAFLPALVSAEWGNWVDNLYCDQESLTLVGEKMQGIEEGTLAPTDCGDYCLVTADENSSQYKKGAPLCCQFENWDDGSQTCFLYMGEKTQPFVGEGGQVKAMNFFYGDNAAKLAASAALLVAAALY